MKNLSKLFFATLILGITGCGSHQHNNFNKQKYTKLKQNTHYEAPSNEMEETSNATTDFVAPNEILRAENEVSGTVVPESSTELPFETIAPSNEQNQAATDGVTQNECTATDAPESTKEEADEEVAANAKRGNAEMGLLAVMATLCLVLGIIMLLVILLLGFLDVTLLPFTIIAVTLLVAAILLYILAFTVGRN